MNNEDLDKLHYTYPDSDVLRNKLNISDQSKLDQAERLYVPLRIIEGVPKGQFDLDHLKRIHKHLFQDLYEWAGETRKTDISKGGNWFMPCDRIDFAMLDVQNRLKKKNYFMGTPYKDFSKEAAVIIGDINMIHPFREGNGRTQLHYLKQLGQNADYDIDLTKFKKETWLEASIESHAANYQPMQKCIEDAIVGRIKGKLNKNGKECRSL